MSVDAATVRRIAHLARIAVAEDEVEHLQGELNAMLAFVEQLSEVNVEGVEPMTSVTPMAMKKREDMVTDGGIAEDVLQERAGERRTTFSSSPRWWSRMCIACEMKTLFARQTYRRSTGTVGRDARSRARMRAGAI